MTYLKFQRVNFRDRGIYVPFEEAVTVSDKEEERRVIVLIRLRNTLHKSWRNFSLEHFDDVPDNAGQGDMLPEFLSAYVEILWQFKRLRKQGKSIQKYSISIRLHAYDEVYSLWKDLAKLWDDRYLKRSEFEDRLINTTLTLGMVMRELKLIGEHKMNAAEYVIQRELQQKKAASTRHIENHQLRDAVFLWADENIKPGISLDSAASAVSEKIVPLKWRTVREHLTEWKKLRSAGTP